MWLILGVLINLAVPVGIVVLIVWLVGRSSKSSPVNKYPEATRIANEHSIRQKIAAEIRAQLSQYGSAAQKKVVEDMAQTVEYFGTHSYNEQPQQPGAKLEPAYPEPNEPVPQQLASAPVAAASTAQPAVVSQPAVEPAPWREVQRIDGAVILLYLGAFFVLASIGLYVGFGGGTSVKAVLSTLLAFGFYIAGLALYRNSTRLKPAGQTFVAIGMATIPMAGAAIYYFGLNKSHGPAVWLATSLVALGLYIYATYVLRSVLVSYMVVFSSLSIVLSTISVIGLAPYYFIQGIGIAGLVFAILSQIFKKYTSVTAKAYGDSATFFVPLSIGLSVLLFTNVGFLRLALSLALGALYYGYMWLNSEGYKATYSMLAQLMSIAAVFSGSYGLYKSGKSVALTAGVIGVFYVALWLGKLLRSDGYLRLQTKIILLTLPWISFFALLGSPKLLWAGLAFAGAVSLLIHVSERDMASITGWVLALLGLPSLVGFVTIQPRASVFSVGIVYAALGLAMVAWRYIARAKINLTERVTADIVLVTVLIVAMSLQAASTNQNQMIVAIITTLVALLRSYVATDKNTLFMLAGVWQLFMIFAFVENPKYLFAQTAIIAGRNFFLGRFKLLNRFHDWLAVVAALFLPLAYGLPIAEPNWTLKTFFTIYAAGTLGLLAVRYFNKGLSSGAATFGYLACLVTALTLGFVISPVFGLIAATIGCLVLLAAEKVEKASVLGYIAPLLPLATLFAVPTAHQILAMICIMSGVGLVLTALRRRVYESLLATIGVTTLPMYMAELYNWKPLPVVLIYAAIGLALVAKVYLWRSVSWLKPAFRVGYLLALMWLFIYGFAGDWYVGAIAWFGIGLILCAISYVESKPWVISPSLLAGNISLLITLDGTHMKSAAMALILAGLAQVIYWMLIFSKLATRRAAWARNTEIVVTGLVLFSGLPESWGYGAITIGLGAMLLKEVWAKAHVYREISILIIHVGILWLLHALGVREFQVYSQSVALVIFLFAWWRRKLGHSHSLVNGYLWTAVLTFTLPMVIQAITSDKTIYSYLVLVEHVILIIVSILYKRATFAWWGIAVVVASMLYQLRKLRYAALAFLGAFIIGLAVYFLLRYNKPDSSKK